MTREETEAVATMFAVAHPSNAAALAVLADIRETANRNAARHPAPVRRVYARVAALAADVERFFREASA